MTLQAALRFTCKLPSSQQWVCPRAAQELDPQRLSVLLEQFRDRGGFVDCFQGWPFAASKLHPQ